MNRRAFLTRPLSNQPSSGNGYSRPRTLATTGLEPYTGPWTYPDAAHLLRRTMFGSKRAEVEAILAKTKDQAVDMLLAPPPANKPVAPINYIGASAGTEWGTSAYDATADQGRFTYLQTWYFQQMINQPISISEKMTLFWHNHFSCGYNAVKDARYMYKQNAMLRQNALGNFKDLAVEIALDPAMLVYLNGNVNTKIGPNENLGRELQELFTIGKGPEIAPGNYTNYTEADIKAAARVLTGWADDKTGITYTFAASNHDTSDKQFSAAYQNTIIRGKTGSLGGIQELGDLITMIFTQQATAQYICSKIYRWFVSTQITPEIEQLIINPLADILKAGNYEIKPVMDKLLKSAHFFDAANRGGLIKNPMDFGVGLLRSYPVDSFDRTKVYDEPFLPSPNNGIQWALRPFRRTIATMQYDLFNPPNVAGYAAYYQTPQFDELWINADTLQKRIKLIDDLTVVYMVYDEAYGYALINVIELAKQTSDASLVTKLIDEWMMMLFPFAMTTEQKQTAHGVFLGSLTDNDWKTMWNNYKQDSTNVTKIAAVEAKLRPLLRHLMGLAEYQLM